MKLPQVRFDAEADCLYVRLSAKPVAKSQSLDDLRLVDYAADESVVGVEFIGVGGGIDLSGIPSQETIEKAVRKYDFKILV